MKAIDPEVLGAVYRDQAPKLWRALVAYAGADVADEALSEAFVQAAGRGAAIRAPDRWVWTAAFRIAAGQLRQRETTDLAQHPVLETDATDALDLLDALGKLAPRQRVVLVLHYYGGYKTREIAQIVGSTGATVRVHLSAGRKRLRELLEVRDEG